MDEGVRWHVNRDPNQGVSFLHQKSKVTKERGTPWLGLWNLIWVSGAGCD